MNREGENYKTSNLTRTCSSRLAVAGIDWGDGGGEAVVRFRRIEYFQGACNGGVCTLAISSQTTSGPLTLMPGEGASMDIGATAFGVRGVVFSNRPDVTVTAQTINTFTGEVTSHVIMANTEGDFH